MCPSSSGVQLPDTLIHLHLGDVSDLLPTLVDGSAALIVADPPWRYADSASSPKRGGAANHYSTLPVETIGAHLAAAFRVAAPDSYLCLWITWPCLDRWPMLNGMLQAVGWVFISGGAWTKSGNFGIGHHWRCQSEAVLLYRKGRPSPCAHIPNGWVAPRGIHSEKPQCALRDLTRAFCPPGGLTVDLYAGASGSLARAVRAVGGDRRYLGCEVSPTRHAEALQRLALEEQQEMDLLEVS